MKVGRKKEKERKKEKKKYYICTHGYLKAIDYRRWKQNVYLEA